MVSIKDSKHALDLYSGKEARWRMALPIGVARKSIHVFDGPGRNPPKAGTANY